MREVFTSPMPPPLTLRRPHPNIEGLIAFRPVTAQAIAMLPGLRFLKVHRSFPQLGPAVSPGVQLAFPDSLEEIWAEDSRPRTSPSLPEAALLADHVALRARLPVPHDCGAERAPLVAAAVVETVERRRRPEPARAPRGARHPALHALQLQSLHPVSPPPHAEPRHLRRPRGNRGAADAGEPVDWRAPRGVASAVEAAAAAGESRPLSRASPAGFGGGRRADEPPVALPLHRLGVVTLHARERGAVLQAEEARRLAVSRVPGGSRFDAAGRPREPQVPLLLGHLSRSEGAVAAGAAPRLQGRF